MQLKVNGNLIEVVSCYGGKRFMLGSEREALEITLQSDYQTVVETFVDDITYSLVVTEEVETITTTTDEEGNVIETPTTETKTYEYDKTSYCLSGDVVDHRNGTITIYMGEMTPEEELLIVLYGGVE